MRHRRLLGGILLSGLLWWQPVWAACNTGPMFEYADKQSQGLSTLTNLTSPSPGTYILTEKRFDTGTGQAAPDIRRTMLRQRADAIRATLLAKVAALDALLAAMDALDAP